MFRCFQSLASTCLPPCLLSTPSATCCSRTSPQTPPSSQPHKPPLPPTSLLQAPHLPVHIIILPPAHCCRPCFPQKDWNWVLEMPSLCAHPLSPTPPAPLTPLFRRPLTCPPHIKHSSSPPPSTTSTTTQPAPMLQQGHGHSSSSWHLSTAPCRTCSPPCNLRSRCPCQRHPPTRQRLLLLLPAVLVGCMMPPLAPLPPPPPPPAVCLPRACTVTRQGKVARLHQ
mmetsp:Transcript_11821/g.32263  ORF Transcript_11821/g.32263 Transcript_11821/m.32263 type:complete len:225 (-) Transcript_11821:1182-1856(-)